VLSGKWIAPPRQNTSALSGDRLEKMGMDLGWSAGAMNDPARRAPGGARYMMRLCARQLADACPTTFMNSSTIWRRFFSGSAPTC
jgi:hypothetical protein